MHIKMLSNKGCHTAGSLFLLTIAVVFFTACNSSGRSGKLNLYQAWFSKKFVTASGMELSNTRVVRFYENGTYTMFGAGGYNAGKWFHSAKKTTITLEPESGNLNELISYWRYEPVTNSDKLTTMVYSSPAMIPGTAEGSFVLEGFGNKGKIDPFAPAMHSWQLKPAKAETLAEIKLRVLGYLHFLESLYSYMLKNDVEAIAANWFPEPILMNYTNGVRMAYSDELDSWNTCFFDDTQAVKGYQYLSGALRSVTLINDENRFERNLNCVEQLINTIKNTEILKE